MSIMKNFIFIISIFFIGLQSYSQCNINPFIQNNYEMDAKVFALREILNNPSDPDYDNPFIPEERYTPYLERLSALYENPHNSPMVDSLFNEFNFHVNLEYTNPTPISAIMFSVDSNIPWVEDFKNTGISGIAILDDLMAEYLFSIESVMVLPIGGITIFTIVTSYDFLNVTALLDDFSEVPDINTPVAAIGLENRFNYTGIPYYIYSDPVEVCDIIISGDQFEFVLYAGDCMAGCMYSESRFAYVTEDCEVLSVSENDPQKFSIYPNPTSSKIYVSGNSLEVASVKIFSTQGKLIQKLNNISDEIDVSQLNSGMYFVEIRTFEGVRNIRKFIKI